jgi:hypothetical protein
MVEITISKIKDLGLNRQVLDALPTAVVGGAFEGSLWELVTLGDFKTLLNHVVPHGQQLKILFLRVWTTDSNGARFSIVQYNPNAAGQTGSVEAFPVVGSVPPYSAGLNAVRDYPMLEAAGAEVLHGSLRDPIHVLEGSITFNLLGRYDLGPTSSRFGFVWWGIEETPEG